MKKLQAGIISLLVICSFSVNVFAASFYVVQPGDMLWQVAKKFNTTYQEIAKVNNLKDANLITVGQKLMIPEAAKPAGPAGVQPGAPVGGPPAGGPPAPAVIKPIIPYPVTPAPSNKSYIHKGDFSVMTVGTGCPDTIVGRAGPSTLVQYKGNYFLVDVGDGASYRLVEAGIDLNKIKNVLITHMHSDHTDGYMKLMVEGWTLGKKEGNVIGIKGVTAMHNIISTVFADDIKYRIGKVGDTKGIYENIKVTELAEDSKTSFELDGVKISTTPTIHAVPNLAYRFDVDGKSIVVSGDTSYSENMIKLAKDADVFVVDSGRVMNKAYLGPGEFKPGPKTPPPPVSDPSLYVAKEVEGTSHGSLEDVAVMAAKANVKKLVLTHYPPFEVDQEATLKQYRMFYKGEIVFGQDLLEVTP